MSRAFVNEEATQSIVEIPNRVVSDRANLVTASGLDMMDRRIAELKAAKAALDPDAPDDATAKEREAIIARDLRYWTQRRATAQLVTMPDGPLEQVVFGSVVTVRDTNGKERRYRLVGEDEADPAAGLLNWSAPLAEALMGAMVGDEVSFGPNRPPVLIVSIDRA